MGLVMSILDNKNNLILCLTTICVGIGLLLPSSAGAQERQGLVLNAGLSVQSDSNITRTVEKTSDKLSVFSPQLQFLSNIGQHQFVFDYQGRFAAYNDNSQYNYNDHDFKLGAQLGHSYRFSSEFALGYQDKIEEPGANNAAPQVINEFNQRTRKTALAKFYYGTRASSGQLVLGLDHNQQRYTNNQQSFRDLDQNTLTGTFFYRMAPKTRLLFEASVARFDNVAATLTRDRTSDEHRYLTGVEWATTAITSGTFKVGYQQRDFADDSFNDLDGLSYYLDMLWRPNTYTKIKIGAKRETRESAQQDIGGFISTGYSLTLGHALSSRTQLNAKYQQDESDFNNAQNRADKRKNITVGIAHGLRTWLDISLAYRHSTRSSNDEIYAFSSDSVELSLNSKFD
jgi:hypothetical protein